MIDYFGFDGPIDDITNRVSACGADPSCALHAVANADTASTKRIGCLVSTIITSHYTHDGGLRESRGSACSDFNVRH
jgi:hypothetical protein